MQNDTRDNREHFYDVPVETLGLSDNAIKMLEDLGGASVGDCLDHFSRVGSCTILVPFGFIEIMHTEVLQMLVRHGYMSPEEAKNYVLRSD